MGRTTTRSRQLALGIAAAVAVAVAVVVWVRFAGPAGGAASARETSGTYREMRWEDLVPADWDVVQRFKMRHRAELDDGSLRAEALQREMRALWDNAPTVGDLDGAAVTLAGYVVPLQEVDGALTEFLLVPYFGACIHTPPPPANQIVLVTARAAQGFRAMDAVRVSGRLSVARQDSSMGASGYRLAAAAVERHLPPATP